MITATKVRKKGIPYSTKLWWSKTFGGSTHPDILVEKTLADDDNKLFLLMCTYRKGI